MQGENPFKPVFGRVPAHMAGREQIIEDMTRAFDVGEGDPNLCSLFVGARGTGKTALLTYLGSKARSLGWIVADVTASQGMLEDIYLRVLGEGDHLLGKPGGKKLAGVSIAHIGSLSWHDSEESPSNWRSRMNSVLDALEETGTGVLITVDEVDPSLDEMTSLVTVYQHFVREGRKVALIMAGLPHRVSGLLSGETTSFLRRAARHDLSQISDYEVKEAFALTLASGGRTIEPHALEQAATAIGGFPFMLQLVGYRSWNAAGQKSCLEDADVEFGAARAREELKERLFDATYAELSDGDRAFLKAMAVDEVYSDRGDIAQRLNRSSSHVSTYKKRLLEAGLINEPWRGTFAFALPGFRDYMLSMP